MKDKILNALKQEYAHLGLGDGILSGLAEMLASTSLVTDENLKGIVAGQKAYLEDLQKSNDKRVQDAVTKTQKEASDKADAAEKQHKADVEKLQKEYDEYKTAHPEQPPLTPPAEDKEIPEWYKKEKAEREQANALKEKAWQEKLDAIEKAKTDSEAKFKAIEEAKKASDAKLKAIEDAKAKEEAERAATLRRETINGKAKEKGIPDWMIAHGFADIGDDADDAKIDEILSRYASEIQTNFLPGKNSLPQFDGKQATKADTDSIVAKIFPGVQKQQ